MVGTRGKKGKTLPMNNEAEMSVLGGVLIESTAIDKAIEVLSQDGNDFYHPAHAAIFKNMCVLYEKKIPIDVVTLAGRMKGDEILDGVGGISYVGDLVEYTPTAANILYYARIVKELSVKRELITSATKLLEELYDGNTPVEELVNHAQHDFLNISTSSSQPYTDIATVGKEVYEEFKWLHENNGGMRLTGLSTGFFELNDVIGGFQKTDLIVIGGRPSMGKSSLSTQIAAHIALQGGKVGFFPVEVGKKQLVRNILACQGRINTNSFRDGQIKDIKKLERTVKRMCDTNIMIDDYSRSSVEIVRQARRMKRNSGLDIVFVDHLHLMRENQRFENRSVEIDFMVNNLKGLAKELDIPVVVLCQLNRQVEMRNPPEPKLSDLKECLPGDALVLNADTGERVPIGRIVESNLRFNVQAVDENLKLTACKIEDAWVVGEKDVYEVTTHTGRSLRCTAEHKLRTFNGFVPLKEISSGEKIALPREYVLPDFNPTVTIDRATLLGWLVGDGCLTGSPRVTVETEEEENIVIGLAKREFDIHPYTRSESLPTHAYSIILSKGRFCGAGKNPLTTWLREIGIWKTKSITKHVPEIIFKQPCGVIAGFLRGLFATDASFTTKSATTSFSLRLTTISKRLAHDAQHLLLRMGIISSVRKDRHSSGNKKATSEHIYTVGIYDRENTIRFCEKIGFLLERHRVLAEQLVPVKNNDAGHIDRLPLAVNDYITMSRKKRGWSHTKLGWRDQRKHPSRSQVLKLSDRLEDDNLRRWATSDVIWDEILSVKLIGKEPVYDITVGDSHNFCVNDFITHNSGSIEQTADIVIFLYRPEYYDKNTEKKGIAEILLEKHRNGALTRIDLRWNRYFLRFENPSDEVEPEGEETLFDEDTVPF